MQFVLRLAEAYSVTYDLRAQGRGKHSSKLTE